MSSYIRNKARKLRRSLESEDVSPYKPLSTKRPEICVLDIRPGSGEAMVECTMRQVLLSKDHCQWETISYCWGQPRDPAYIKLNGCVVPVPASSEAAVRRMRLPDRPRTLWIDAICINQPSNEERSQQASLMSDIYHVVHRNLIYLGEDTNGLAERCVECIGHMHYEWNFTAREFSVEPSKKRGSRAHFGA